MLHRPLPRAAVAALALALSLCLPPLWSAPLARLSVTAGDLDRPALPLSVDLSGLPLGFPGTAYRLQEVTDTGRRDVPVQFEAGSPPRLWFLLTEPTPAGTTRRFELSLAPKAPAPGVTVERDDRVLLVKQGGHSVMSYNHGIVPPPPLSVMGEKYRANRRFYFRSGFIHPLWSPRGSILTNIHPSDHYHHLGIWNPWTHTQYKGKGVDFWNLGLGQGTVRCSRVLSTVDGPVFGGFQIEQEHVVRNDPNDETDDEVVLKDVWDVRVYNLGGPETGTWLWDYVSTQRCVADTPLELEAYRYGGFGFRATAQWDEGSAAYLTSEGKNRKNGHSTTARWCDVAGISDGQWKGITFLSHPDNLRHPEPMRIWPQGQVFFNWCPIQKEPLEMPPGRDFQFRYRQVVHEGKSNAAQAETLWRAYATPPRVTLTPAPSPRAVQLFDGTGFDHWTAGANKPIGWTLADGAMTIVPRSGSLTTREDYRDFRLHLEFKVPQMPPQAQGQGRGNSGIYIQRRYEVQILDSYGREPEFNGCASLYRQRPPDRNVCRLPEQWQSYDIVFHAARFADGKKSANARITVWHNGVLVHNDVELTNKTGAGRPEGPEPGPILLQDHGNPVAYRNIWIESL